MDVAKRYNVDGIHLDDYFYPYAGMLGGKKFPDDASYRRFRLAGGRLSLADWRRNNINLFVRDLGLKLRVDERACDVPQTREPPRGSPECEMPCNMELHTACLQERRPRRDIGQHGQKVASRSLRNCRIGKIFDPQQNRVGVHCSDAPMPAVDMETTELHTVPNVLDGRHRRACNHDAQICQL